jgi:hypothetical protein
VCVTKVSLCCEFLAPNRQNRKPFPSKYAGKIVGISVIWFRQDVLYTYKQRYQWVELSNTSWSLVGEWSTLASAQDGDQRSATLCGRITSGENATGIRELRSWVGATVDIKDSGNKTNALPLSSPTTSHTWFAVRMNTWKTTEFMTCHIFLIDTCCQDHR